MTLRDENWGVRSMPQISSRYPLWDQPDLAEQVDAGRWYLPDAEEGRRERLVTSVLDAEPMQVLRVGGPSWRHRRRRLARRGIHRADIPLVADHDRLRRRLPRAAPQLAVDRHGRHSREGDQGRAAADLDLPLYASGPASVGWWAMFITMIGDGTAFGSLVFGYFFYWTVQANSPPAMPGPASPGRCSRACCSPAAGPRLSPRAR